MKERPILFSAPMVRAILAGQKTQTRRVVKPAESQGLSYIVDCMDGTWGNEEGDMPSFCCPYGQPGDRLWVREAFRFPKILDRLSPAAVGERSISAGYSAAWCPTQYEADGARRTDQEWIDFVTPPMATEPGRLRAGRHMPRWASRITLNVTSIHVERLQDISLEDCIAEGVSTSLREHDAACDLKDQYHALWETINGAGSWDANPWVWVVEFRRMEGGAA